MSSSLDKLIKQMEKKYGEGALLKTNSSSVSNVERIPVSSPKIGDILGRGGIPRGRYIELYGPESSGKCIAFDTEVTIKVEDDFYKFLVNEGYCYGEKRTFERNMD